MPGVYMARASADMLLCSGGLRGQVAAQLVDIANLTVTVT
jgi:hypothetical protein